MNHYVKSVESFEKLPWKKAFWESPTLITSRAPGSNPTRLAA